MISNGWMFSGRCYYANWWRHENSMNGFIIRSASTMGEGNARAVLVILIKGLFFLLLFSPAPTLNIWKFECCNFENYLEKLLLHIFPYVMRSSLRSFIYSKKYPQHYSFLTKPRDDQSKGDCQNYSRNGKCSPPDCYVKILFGLRISMYITVLAYQGTIVPNLKYFLPLTGKDLNFPGFLYTIRGSSNSAETSGHPKKSSE